jgi:amino acid transporter
MALVLWLVTGLLSLAGALCYAELGTLIPGSGGEAQYLQKAFGSWATFVFNWASILLLKPGTVAGMVVAMAKYMIMFVCNITRCQAPTGSAYYWLVKGISLFACALVTFAASVSTKTSLQIQAVMTYGKIFALAFVIFSSFYHLMFVDRTNFVANLSQPFAGTNWSLGTYAPAITHGLFSFDGWNNLNIIAGDLANPGTNLPLAIWISMAAVVLLYLLTIFAYYSTLPVDVIKHSSTIGVEFGAKVAGVFGSILMPFFVVNSTFGSALSSMATSSEIVILAADNGHLPKLFGHINKRFGTAVNAYVMQGILSALLVFSVDFDDLVNIYILPTWIFYGACVVVLLMMRVGEPNAHRPYKVWISTSIIFLAACIFLLSTSLWTQPWIFAASVGVVLLAVPIYFFFVRA